jgi:Coenzyme PQQ synthesis protein D (PqqD)
MIMSAADSTLFTLNRIATVIWLAADGNTPLTEIVRKSVCAGRKVDPDIAYQDAVEFAEALAQHGILRISDRPFCGLPAESGETL